MLKIYGSPRSSAGRCYLVMEEAGVPYLGTPLDMMDKREHKSPDYLRLNPNGKVPCLVDGDFVLWESLAINLYIAEKYKPELLGQGPQSHALIEQWSLWALGELQSPLIDILIQTKFVAAEKRDEGVITRAREKVPALLRILDHALAGREYLLGGKDVSLADLNVATVVNIAPAMGMELNSYSHLVAWFERIKARPSFKKFVEMREGGKKP